MPRFEGLPEAAPTLVGPSGMAAPPWPVDAAQVGRLRRFLDWMTPIVFAFAPADMAVGFAFGSRPSMVLGALLLGVGFVLLWARTALRRGHLETAVLVTALLISLSTPVIVFLRPHLFPVLAMGSLLAVSVALPFLHGARLRRLVAASWLTSTAVIVIGDSLVTPVSSDVPPVVIRWSVGLSLAILLGLVLLMMVQFSSRLNDTLQAMRSAQAEVQASNERLRQLHRMKTDFMNQAAHELNTPLTPVRLQLHLLKDNGSAGLDPRQRRAVEIVDRNVERLASLVRDLLDASRLEAGRLVLQRRPVAARRLLADVLETFAEPAQRAGVALESEAGPELVADVDAKRITQVLYNLVLNAIKFTPEGGRVGLALDARGSRVRFVVSDTGIGLRPDDHASLFQPFSQAGHLPGAAPTGTGLGLYISRGIVEAHGGRIWAESEGPGRGSTFAFEVPLASPIPDARAGVTTAPAPA